MSGIKLACLTTFAAGEQDNVQRLLELTGGVAKLIRMEGAG